MQDRRLAQSRQASLDYKIWLSAAPQFGWLLKFWARWESVRGFQAFFRERQPPALIIWGKNDTISPVDGAYSYQRDLPKVEFHLFDTGHLALEDKADELVPLMRDFLDRNLATK